MLGVVGGVRSDAAPIPIAMVLRSVCGISFIKSIVVNQHFGGTSGKVYFQVVFDAQIDKCFRYHVV